MPCATRIEKLAEDVAAGVYTPAYVPVPEYLPHYHVHDYTKSAEWNTLYLERNNKARENACRANAQAEAQAFAKFNEDLGTAIREDFGFTRKQANLITAKAYEMGHSGGFQETMNLAVELARLCSDVITAA